MSAASRDQVNRQLIVHADTELERLRARVQKLTDALRGVARIVEAISYTMTLGRTQLDRLKAAKDLLAEEFKV